MNFFTYNRLILLISHKTWGIHVNQTKLFAGSSNKPLATEVARRLSLPLERVDLGKFNDGELSVELKDNVRGSKAFIIQSTCAPANDTLMEMILMADALYRSSTEKIIAVVPYFGYARQDRRPGYARTPISARVIADLIQAVKIDHLVTIDLHTTQIQGFFDIPVDNLSANRLFVQDIKDKYMSENTVVVSPDIGGVVRARSVAKNIGADLAIIDKRRPKANVSEVMNIIGEIEGKDCILTDDIIDTAGTLTKAASALMERGANRVIAYCTHPVLSGPACERLADSVLTELVVTDTIPLSPECDGLRIRQISTAAVLAETIRRLDNGESISELSN
ncbi:MAG: ribose-phosphate pyrophosphokinase [Methylotenera sp.]|nr:MAG: ribose-phosphate pyrophosphokinase [Methylotenera sp.]